MGGGNEYCKLILAPDNWRLVDGKTPIKSIDKITGVCPAAGNIQFVDKKNTKMMLLTDMALVWDAAFKKHVDIYANDDTLLKNDFGNAFKKLTEFGCGQASKL